MPQLRVFGDPGAAFLSVAKTTDNSSLLCFASPDAANSADAFRATLHGQAKALNLFLGFRHSSLEMNNVVVLLGFSCQYY